MHAASEGHSSTESRRNEAAQHATDGQGSEKAERKLSRSE
jgi:hypothetical protein